ncbi:NAD(P)H-dependent oxidoreductase [uncultured Christiangramia sp.]|uniref:NAD(P)H-dependent oxidoreductase n=1 Tax=uncultured Christiangramia sp. TaxID=503836 RepID=UPI0025D4E697|nr:NAD(P)H-dependent oxidoreductase [uncultured Christiangramia sp.]|tara:strand:+ start:1504 stop:2136 length:633 start_codon:yes stop_codon:yes gene_type:complete
MSNLKALNWRYATKKFDDSRILSEEKLEILKHAFNLTATSYGLQPLKMLVISNKEVQKQLTEFSMNQQQVSTASHVLVICTEKNVDEKFISGYFQRVKNLRDTPDELLQPFHNFLVDDFKNKAIEEIEAWARNQAYLALGTLLTVCATEEIDACPMEGFEPEKYDDFLKLGDKNLQSVLVLPVGYRAKDDFFSELKKVRRPLEEVIIEMD